MCVSLSIGNKISRFYRSIKGEINQIQVHSWKIFVDNFRRFSFVFIQRYTSGNVKVKSKMEFEQCEKTHGIDIEHYHADNGRLSDKLFIDHARQKH